MRKALIMTLASVASLAAFSTPVQARDGCGDGWHRDGYGDCRPNHYNRYYGDRYYGARDPYYGRDRVIVDPDIDSFYPGRGYWSGDRYYWHRRWDGDSWRYW
jgi:hypothetical protein